MSVRFWLGALAIGLALAGYAMRPTPEWGFGTLALPDLDLPPTFETVFSYTSPEGTAHAPAILPGDGGAFGVIWFDGLRESHNDVRILGVSFPGPSAVTEVLTRQSVSGDMVPAQTVLTLGNTVGDGAGGLFATIVSLGGWAASSVAHLRSTDGVIEQAQRLDLSPLLGRSHLVKSPVVAMAQGAMLPVYFEMGNAYGAAALLDETGRVRGLSDMRGAQAIQPVVVPLSEVEAVAFLRDFSGLGGFVHVTRTNDGGATWSAPIAMDLPNPSAPVAALRLSDGQILMVFNDDGGSAEELTFAVSSDQGATWARGAKLGTPGGGDLRYPMLAVLGDGRIALTYSSGGKSGIQVHVFTQQWVLGQ